MQVQLRHRRYGYAAGHSHYGPTGPAFTGLSGRCLRPSGARPARRRAGSPRYIGHPRQTIVANPSDPQVIITERTAAIELQNSRECHPRELSVGFRWRKNGAQGRNRTTDTVIFSHVTVNFCGFQRTCLNNISPLSIVCLWPLACAAVR